MTKPIKFLFIMDANPIGSTWVEIEYDEWKQIEDHPRGYDFFVLEGIKAKIFVAFYSQHRITRGQAIQIASSCVLGLYEKWSIDDRNLIIVKEAGIPIHPPY